MATSSRAPRSSDSRPSYRCVDCGWSTSKWAGRCSQCQAWGTVEERRPDTSTRTTVTTPSVPALAVDQVDATKASSRSSGLAEFDRVLGDGLVPGAVVLLSGEPGAGKSTLLLEVAARSARAGQTVLYVTGEESTAQVKLRAERTGCIHPKLLLAAETDLSVVLGHVEATNPDLFILDSVQTVASGQVDGTPGNVSQVREVTACLVQQAKRRHLTTVLVGHVTKDGSIAGPRLLEHAVDVVTVVEGDRYGRLRLVRSTKNRYGPTDEVGCFELTETGMQEVVDPSALFTSRRDLQAPGSALTVTLEGSRPLLVELQALVGEGGGQQAKRAFSGVNSTRASIIAAVLTNRLRIDLGGRDLFVATVGGAKVHEPAADLAMALAIASAGVELAVPAKLVAFGEVGLSGEIRPVPGLLKRLHEAARLGFTTAAVPLGVVDPLQVPTGLKLVELGQLVDILRRGLLDAATPMSSSASRGRPRTG